MRLVVLGAGFTGTAVARLARSRAIDVVATTRSAEAAAALQGLGVVPIVSSALAGAEVDRWLDPDDRVLVTFPPDAGTDGPIAAVARRAASIAYVSSTAVHGDLRGHIDESTPVRPSTARGVARIEAEERWRAAGATIVRAAGIYGPGRGIHLRLARGALRLAGDGTNVTSRVHVEDLAAALFGLLARGSRGGLFVMADREPVAHAEAVRWVCEALAIPLPASDPLASPGESLESDRRVDARRIRDALGLELAFPNYREGYAHCIERDREAIDRALAGRAR